MVLKQPSAGRTGHSGIELQGAQIPLRDESSQPSFESGSNYRVLKLDVRCAGLANWFEGIGYRGSQTHVILAPRRFEGLEEDKLQGSQTYECVRT